MQLHGYTWRRRQRVNPAIITAMQQERAPQPEVFRFTHPHWVIDYTPQDAGLYRVHKPTNPWQRRTPDSFHIYAPHIVYWENMAGAPQKNIRSSFVIFRGGGELGLDAIVRKGDGHAVILDPYHTMAANMMEIAQAGETRREAGFALAQSLMWKIADAISTCIQTGPATYQVSAPVAVAHPASLVTEVDTYLSGRLGQPIRLTELAEIMKMSPSTLSHRYRKLKGTSPIATLIQLRIETAKVLLHKGYGLKTIAAQTGFTDAFHLSRTFKQLNGVSPREFLKQGRQ